MLEQTIMLLMHTYAGWVSTACAGEHLSLRLNQARLLLSVSDQVRADLARRGIQILPAWLPAHGTNVTSPLFTKTQHGHPAREIQAVYIPPTHPRKPGRTLYRLSRHFHERPDGGGSTFLQSRRPEPPGKPSKRPHSIHICLRRTTMEMIRKSIGPSLGTGRFLNLTLAFKLMDDAHPHPHPFLGFPSIGPYTNYYNMANSLGLRVEWQAAGGNIHSVPIPWNTILTSTLNGELLRTKEVDIGRLTGAQKFQDVMGIINMLRCQTFSDPSPVFNVAVNFGWSAPVVRLLRINHLEQTLSWETLQLTKVPCPREATFAENAATLVDAVRQGTLGLMTSTIRPQDGMDAMYNCDETSKRAARMTGPICDTCYICEDGNTSGRKQCTAIPNSKTCQVCKRLSRPLSRHLP